MAKLTCNAKDHIPRYDEVKYFVGTKRFVTHSMLEIKLNFRYVESRKIIHAIQADGIIADDFDIAQGGYEVFQKTYAEQTRQREIVDNLKV